MLKVIHAPKQKAKLLAKNQPGSGVMFLQAGLVSSLFFYTFLIKGPHEDVPTLGWSTTWLTIGQKLLVLSLLWHYIKPPQKTFNTVYNFGSFWKNMSAGGDTLGYAFRLEESCHTWHPGWLAASPHCGQKRLITSQSCSEHWCFLMTQDSQTSHRP